MLILWDCYVVVICMPCLVRNSLVGDTISGCWATVGVLTEKGTKKTSSTGKNFCIWKFGCLDEATISVFLFGDAYTKHWKESSGTVFALFNSNVRKDAQVWFWGKNNSFYFELRLLQLFEDSNSSCLL